MLIKQSNARTGGNAAADTVASPDNAKEFIMKTYFCKGKKMYKYPSRRTIERLIAKGYSEMVWQNGDFLCIG